MVSVWRGAGPTWALKSNRLGLSPFKPFAAEGPHPERTAVLGRHLVQRSQAAVVLSLTELPCPEPPVLLQTGVADPPQCWAPPRRRAPHCSRQLKPALLLNRLQQHRAPCPSHSSGPGKVLPPPGSQVPAPFLRTRLLSELRAPSGMQLPEDRDSPPSFLWQLPRQGPAEPVLGTEWGTERRAHRVTRPTFFSWSRDTPPPRLSPVEGLCFNCGFVWWGLPWATRTPRSLWWVRGTLSLGTAVVAWPRAGTQPVSLPCPPGPH